jgi:hypothetical protein
MMPYKYPGEKNRTGQKKKKKKAAEASSQAPRGRRRGPTRRISSGRPHPTATPRPIIRPGPLHLLHLPPPPPPLLLLPFHLAVLFLPPLPTHPSWANPPETFLLLLHYPHPRRARARGCEG